MLPRYDGAVRTMKASIRKMVKGSHGTCYNEGRKEGGGGFRGAVSTSE